jgi:hypothetical protein
MFWRIRIYFPRHQSTSLAEFIHQNFSPNPQPRDPLGNCPIHRGDSIALRRDRENIKKLSIAVEHPVKMAMRSGEYEHCQDIPAHARRSMGDSANDLVVHRAICHCMSGLFPPGSDEIKKHAAFHIIDEYRPNPLSSVPGTIFLTW